MQKSWRRARGRDWLLASGPAALAGRPEGWVFALSCLLALALVFLGDLRAASHGSVGALAFIPVVAAAWLLSRGQATVVAALAMAFRIAAIVTGTVPVVTGVAEFVTIPVLALLGQLAAESVVGS